MLLFCQIGDYGLARFMYPNDYLTIQRLGKENVRNNEDKLPMRWFPPEILVHLNNRNFDITERLRRFPKTSSVWTLGVTLWEIASLGDTPFSHIYSNQFQCNADIETLLKDGPGAIEQKVRNLIIMIALYFSL